MLDITTIASSKINELAVASRYEVAIVLPAIDLALATKLSDVMQRRTRQDGVLVLVEDDLRLGFIMVANLVYAKTESRYFAYVAQDAFPSEYWLDTALDTIKGTGRGLLAFNDGKYFGTLAAFGLVDRTWVRTLYKNFLFFPGYTSHFADTELSAIATETDNITFNPNAILLEVDYEKHLRRNNLDDHRLYIERAKTGFGGIITPFTPA